MESSACVLCGFTILLLALFPLLRRFYEWYQVSVIVNKIPGPLTLPLIGTLWQEFSYGRRNIFELVQKNTKKYPYIYRAWFTIYPEVYLSKAEYVDKILTQHLVKDYSYGFLSPWLGDGLLIGSGVKWQKHRKIITPTFHLSLLISFCEIFGEQSAVLVQNLTEKIEQTGKEAVDVCPFIAKAALDIICETAMGAKINSQGQSEIKFVKAIYDIVDLSLDRAFAPWLLSDFIYGKTAKGKLFFERLKTVHEFSLSVIEERKKTRAAEKLCQPKTSCDDHRDRLVFLDLLLDAHDRGDMTLLDVRNEVNTFVVAGHETSSTALSYILFCIGNSEKVQQKIMEELNSIFDDSERTPSYHDLNEMRYLECVVKEAMRLFPPIPIIGRMTNESVEVGGYMIPKDCCINIELHQILRDPVHFPNPEVFDPDRFLPENSSFRHQYAFIPFSAGPRNCIGQKFAILELKTMLSTIMRRFRIRSADKLENLPLLLEIVLRPRDGIKLHLEKWN